ncbi:LCP family protein [Erysipelothrix sp. HDW6A]|uniref:LCP family protein n=1 Tax=Erysipelothrix sp. HDW6A TaxID=2714928 RepID=UPI0014079ADF|nr:LCP family protein [Erysipelothrix sp. HDW6A]QIK56972.1 LCP family protein [Erysipelothrix sp. HDW6A]
MKNKNKNIKENFLFSSKFIFGILVVAVIVPLYFINSLNLLPSKYLMIVVIGLAVVLGIFAVLLFKTKGKVRGASKVVSLLVSLALLFTTRYVMQGGDLLSKLTGANKDTHVISMVVKADSPYEKFNDIKDLSFGANTTMDSEGITSAKELIQEKKNATPTVVDYSSYGTLGTDLLEGKIEVILLSEAHRGLMNEFNPGFDEQTKVIDYVSYDEEVAIDKPEVNVLEDTFSVFITGIDTYGPVSTVSRSDVNMIMTVNPKTHQILLTSIPRDYHVKLGTKGAMDKLTHAGIYGVGESVKTLENLFGINIDYYLKVNFTSVQDIVNALGGVDVYSKYTFTSLHGNYNFTKGMNHINGSQALGFVRERYSLPGGDNDRVTNQQELIKGILNKAMSPAILTNYSSILKSVGNSMQMSIPQEDFTKLIRNQLDSNDSWEILQYQVYGTGASSGSTYSMPGHNVYVMNPNKESVDKGSRLINVMESGKSITLD